jgi:hypothetical protein
MVLDWEERIDVSMMLSALDDVHRDNARDPVTAQAHFDACMECMRHPTFAKNYLCMLDELMTAGGHDREEALIRVLANAVRLGMYTEARRNIH